MTLHELDNLKAQPEGGGDNCATKRLADLNMVFQGVVIRRLLKTEEAAIDLHGVDAL
ncbi:MAG: hypothetical protein ACE5Z5_07280 [Candidatus Bathyarchaeia archaeon]